MHASTLKPQFRMRCCRCDAYSAQSYRSAAQSILCHHCNIFIGTPACKVCQSEDTQAHQPKSGRWQCNTCGGTFTYRSQPTRAEKRRQTKDLHPPQKSDNSMIEAMPSHDDAEHEDDSIISVCAERSKVICQSVTNTQNFSVSGLNDGLRGLIKTAAECANNRNLDFPIHDFQGRLKGVLRSSDMMYSYGLMSSTDLASAAEEALFGCYLIELMQTLLKLATDASHFSESLSILVNAPSVRGTVDAGFLRIIETSISPQSPTELDESNVSRDSQSANEDQVELSDSDSALEPNNANSRELAICHLTTATTENYREPISYDVEWEWYPHYPTTILSGFSVRLLN